MKVLFVCHRVPFPPKRGGKIRPFNLIRHLTESGHDVTVGSLARTEQERDEAAGLAQHCSRTIVEVISNAAALPRMLARVPTPTPSSFGYFYSPALARRLRAELSTGRYDLVFVHCSSVAPYVAGHRGALKWIDYGDMDSQKWREYSQHRSFPHSAVYWLEAVKLERTERELAKQFDLCTATTRAELETLRGLGVTTASDWFPNGVDNELFSPGTEAYDPNTIAFVGRMDYFPNQQAVLNFCRDVMPALRARLPQIRFEIVGADPPAHIRELGQLPNVTVTGSVPDVRPWVRKAALTVAPLAIARGTQNKILESMAMGVPVVCSPQASGGVDAVAGEHLLVAQTADDYTARILSILQTPELRQRLAAAARARVLSSHTWASSMRRVDGLLQGLAGRARGVRSGESSADGHLSPSGGTTFERRSNTNTTG